MEDKTDGIEEPTTSRDALYQRTSESIGAENSYKCDKCIAMNRMSVGLYKTIGCQKMSCTEEIYGVHHFSLKERRNTIGRRSADCKREDKFV